MCLGRLFAWVESFPAEKGFVQPFIERLLQLLFLIRLNSLDFSYDLAEYLQQFLRSHSQYSVYGFALSRLWTHVINSQIRNHKYVQSSYDYLKAAAQNGDLFVVLKRYDLALIGDYCNLNNLADGIQITLLDGYLCCQYLLSCKREKNLISALLRVSFFYKIPKIPLDSLNYTAESAPAALVPTAPTPTRSTAKVPKDKKGSTKIDEPETTLVDNILAEEIPQESNNEEATEAVSEMSTEDNELMKAAIYFNNIKPFIKQKILLWLSKTRKKHYNLRFVI